MWKRLAVSEDQWTAARQPAAPAQDAGPTAWFLGKPVGPGCLPQLNAEKRGPHGRATPNAPHFRRNPPCASLEARCREIALQVVQDVKACLGAKHVFRPAQPRESSFSCAGSESPGRGRIRHVLL